MHVETDLLQLQLPLPPSRENPSETPSFLPRYFPTPNPVPLDPVCNITHQTSLVPLKPQLGQVLEELLQPPINVTGVSR